MTTLKNQNKRNNNSKSESFVDEFGSLVFADEALAVA